MPRILAADIGATHCRFALYRTGSDASGPNATGPDTSTSNESLPDAAAGPGAVSGLGAVARRHAAGQPQAALLELLGERWLPGASFPDFTDALVSLFAPGPEGEPPLLSKRSPPDAAVMAPAGAISGGICRLANLAWTVRAQDVRDILGIDRVALINDFVAQAWACVMPGMLDAAVVITGSSRPDAPIGVVGAGTGFGQALISGAPPRGSQAVPSDDPLPLAKRAVVFPSEGGHAEVPFVGEEEMRFAAFVARRIGSPRLIGDTVVSGVGLSHLLAFHTGRDVPPREASAEALAHPKVIEWFARFYGRACRLYVLHTLALGGLYVTGGMAQRIPALTHPAFAREFHAAGKQTALLAEVPVWHVSNPAAGMIGAAVYGILHLLPS